MCDILVNCGIHCLLQEGQMLKLEVKLDSSDLMAFEPAVSVE